MLEEVRQALHLARVCKAADADGNRSRGFSQRGLRSRVADEEYSQAIRQDDVAILLRVLVGLGRADEGG